MTTTTFQIGTTLSGILGRLELDRPFVLAVGRGGLRLAEVVARAIDAPLDVILARKVSLQDGVAMPIGAVAAGGVRILDPGGIEHLGLDDEDISRYLDDAADALDREAARLRGHWPEADLTGRTVILVDEGAITGLTMAAAIAAVDARSPGHLYGALGVSSLGAAARLAPSMHALAIVKRVPDHVAAEQHARAQLTAERLPDDDEIHTLLDRRLADLGNGPLHV